jgi:hypothetical protein
MSKRPRAPIDPDCDVSTESDLTKLLHTLVDRCDKPAQLVEILRWHEEAELAEVMRQFLTLPAAAKGALHAFLVMVKGNAASVTVTFGKTGLTLSSPLIAEYISSMTTETSKRMPPSNLQ